MVFGKFALIIFLTRNNSFNILARARKIHVPEKGLAVRARGARFPPQYVRAASVVIRQGIASGVVRIRVTRKKLAEVPRAGLGVLRRVEHFRMRKEEYLLGFGPFTGCLFAKLHQPDFSGRALRSRVEAALAPDHLLHQRGVHTVFFRRSQDVRILAVFLIGAPSLEEAQKTADKNDPEQPPLPALDDIN